jgi:hypothetical protein
MDLEFRFNFGKLEASNVSIPLKLTGLKKVKQILAMPLSLQSGLDRANRAKQTASDWLVNDPMPQRPFRWQRDTYIWTNR